MPKIFNPAGSTPYSYNTRGELQCYANPATPYTNTGFLGGQLNRTGNTGVSLTSFKVLSGKCSEDVNNSSGTSHTNVMKTLREHVTRLAEHSDTSTIKPSASGKRPAHDSHHTLQPAKNPKISGSGRDCSSNIAPSPVVFTPSNQKSIGGTDTDQSKIKATKVIETEVNKFFQKHIKNTVEFGRHDEVKKRLVELCKSVNEDKDRFFRTSKRTFKNNSGRNSEIGATGIKYSEETKKQFREVKKICLNISTGGFSSLVAISGKTLDSWLKPDA